MGYRISDSTSLRFTLKDLFGREQDSGPLRSRPDDSAVAEATLGSRSLSEPRARKRLSVIGVFYAQKPRQTYIIVRMERRAALSEPRALASGIRLLGILLACCPCASALNPSLDINQYAHNAWTIREGFFKGAISSIAQTPDGYLWLGTEFGLLRFDGVRPTPWQPPAGEHLPSTYIRSVLAARDGRLWIGTREGLASWKDGKLTHYPELAGQTVVSLLEDREGTVWAGESATPNGEALRDLARQRRVLRRGRQFRKRGDLLVRGQHGQPLRGSGDRTLAMEAGSSEALPDAGQAARARKRQRRTPDPNP